jgi:hypothetical protein
MKAVGTEPETIDLCAAQRAAVKAKETDIAGLQGVRSALQLQLHLQRRGKRQT